MNRTIPTLDGRLFARKGEAAPAAAVAGRWSGAVAEEPGPQQAAEGCTDGAAKLSVLIRRNPAGHAGSSDVANGRAYPLPRSKQGFRRPQGTIDPASVRPRRQLTVRLDQRDFGRFKNLAETWNTSYQSILESAVTAFVTEAVTGLGETAAAYGGGGRR